MSVTEVSDGEDPNARPLWCRAMGTLDLNVIFFLASADSCGKYDDDGQVRSYAVRTQNVRAALKMIVYDRTFILRI